MSGQLRNRKVFLLTGLLILVTFFCMTVNAEAAWKKNSNGTYSYYSNGKLVKSKWIGQDYYVNSKGVRQKGWLYKGKKWYYFSKTGKLQRNKWIKSGKSMYYAGADGALYTNGVYKIGNYSYMFNKRGVQQRGRRTWNGKTYYFGLKTGRMQTSQWIATKKKYYYYGSDGIMARNQWVGSYYVGKTGTRLTKCWKDSRYLGSTGKALKGLQKIGNTYYYFDTQTWKKVTNTTLTIKGVAWKFDKNGKGTKVTNIPTASVSVENTYYTDPDVSDETLLSAIIYCEAGNQSYTGKLAVGLVIMNRVYNKQFPSKLREVVYQKSQFTPARNGSLTRALKNPQIVNEECKLAASAITQQFKSYVAGQKVYLKIDGKQTQFPYLFFMTSAAYQSCGRTAAYKKIGDHLFFKTWK